MCRMAILLSHYLVISIFICFSNGKSNKPSDAVIYEKPDKGGNFVSYRAAPYMWENMKTLIRKEGLEQIGQVCVSGTFILYQNPGYYVSNPDQIRILSGHNTCIAPGKVMSYQPIAPRDYALPVISVFGATLLRGAVQAVQSSTDLGVGYTQEIKSFIIQGKDSWSVITGDGRTFCLQPKPSLKSPLCMILDLEANTASSIPTRWLRIHKGCKSGPKMVTVTLKNCIEAYSGKLEKLNLSFLKNKPGGIRYDVSGGRNKGEDGTGGESGHNAHLEGGQGADEPGDELRHNLRGEGDEGDEEGIFDLTPINVTDCKDRRNKEVVDLLSYVLSNDFSSNTQVRYPKDKQLSGILYSLELSIDILLEFCSLTSAKFLQIVRELYIEQMEALVWSKIPVDDLEKRDYNQVDPNLDKMLLQCQTELRSSGRMRQYQRMSEVDLGRKKLPIVWTSMDFMHQIYYLGQLPCTNSTHYNVKRCPVYHTTQEALHLVFNTVAAACHVTLGFKTNFFPDYGIAFKSFYLDPLTDLWMDTRIESMKMDQVTFAGMSVVENLQGLGICAGNVFHGVPNLEMYDRDVKLGDPLRKKKK